MDPLSDYRK
jgi:SAM-dependent methyltransferase